MGVYKIAGLIVSIYNQYDFLSKQCKEYVCNEVTTSDISVTVTNDEILQEQLQATNLYSNGYLESVCAYRKLCVQLPRFDRLLLHASVIRANNHGIAFLAPSGIGKTTHTLLWKRLLGDECVIINGDKPIIRISDDLIYAYGTPWAGKENLQTNENVQLTDLCFLERDNRNAASQISPKDCINRIMIQICRSSDAENMKKTMNLVDRLLKCCRLWHIKCDPTIEAAKTAYKAIMGEAYETEI